ncbi:GxxExxY protein [Draconibacterium halophilum]|uniref:GxxExxY protein n=1 Tax=Draconibacterium halophilum TaxID=2706887 RepID=A0A6C0RAW9_9BACT|nr:GxxExxY protein [Draconibacterium halophilum]QIA06603.1 GxxExxY protein [Draconibacterium halophilum]
MTKIDDDLTYLEDVHLAQGLNYLSAYNLETGLLINFGSTSLQAKRLFKKTLIQLILKSCIS